MKKKEKRYVMAHAIESARATWLKVALANGWAKKGKPFFVQYWVNKDGSIEDSVSYKGLRKDLFIDAHSEKEIVVEKVNKTNKPAPLPTYEELEFAGDGDGVEFEIWKHATTGKRYRVPIEIVRDFDNLEQL